MPRPTDQERFDRLIHSRHPCVRFVTHEEADALTLVRDVAMAGGWEMPMWTATSGIHDGLVAGTGVVPQTENAAAALYHLARRDRAALIVLLDLCPHLRDERTLRAWRELVARMDQLGGTVILIDCHDDAPAVVRAQSTEFELSLPGEEELEAAVRTKLRQINRDTPIEVDITRKQLEALVKNLRGLTRRQAEQVIADAVMPDRRLDANDLNEVLATKRRLLGQAAGGLLEYVQSPVDLSEIGGLARLKAWLKARDVRDEEEAVKYGLSPARGVLLLGVQGAGKSMCAKAIAAAWNRPLLRMDVGALYDRYIGESERRLRDALNQAEVMAPIILWIDEIEKAFASAASRSTDGGLSQRMFGTLLTWMQEHRQPVFLVATANDIEALPPELLRKGRFDEIFFVDLPTAEVRRQIFEIHLRKRNRDPQKFDLPRLAEASEGYSGAEIESAIVAGLHDAFAERGELTTRHVLNALENSPPLSVTMAERIENLRAWARGRCVPAD